MIENVSSKIVSLSEKSPDNVDTEVNESQPENVASTSTNYKTESVTQDEGLHIMRLSLKSLLSTFQDGRVKDSIAFS